MPNRVLLLLAQLTCLIQGGYSLASESASQGDSALFDDLPSVYEASKYEQKITKAPPNSMAVVTADEIKKYGYRNFGAIIASLRGFYNTNDRNYGYIGARGFGIPSDYNTRLLLLIDGHRFNDNIYDAFDTTEAFPVDVDMIERVEIIRGPSSSLYGTSAFFGVINIIIKRGRDQNGTNIKGSYGSNDTFKTSLSHGKRFSNGLEAFISGSFYRSDGFNKLYYSEYDQPENNNGWSISNDSELSRKLLATLSYKDFTFQGLHVNRHRDTPTAAYESIFNSHDNNSSDESTYLDLKYEHVFDNQIAVQSRISYNNYRYRGSYTFADELNGGISLINKDLSRGQWWRAEMSATKLFWDRHKITLGGEFQQNFDQFQSNFDADNTHLNLQEHSYKWALLLQDEFSITDNLILNTGIRYDYFSVFGSSVNPRAGLIYSPWEQSSIKFLYGNAFRAPNAFELSYYAPGQIASQNLQPEKLMTYELILEHYFNSQLRGELNFFRTDISNLIAAVAVSHEDETLQNQNSGKIQSQGIELQLDGNWSNGWQGRFSYTWQHTYKQENHQRLVNSPEHMLKFNVIAPLWNDSVFLGFETQVMSQRSTPSGGNVKGFIVSNLTLYTQKLIKGIDLSASVYNLFDQRYFDPASDAHRQNGIEQDRITYRLKASVDF